MEQRDGLYRNKSQRGRSLVEHLAGDVWLIGTDYILIVFLLAYTSYQSVRLCFVLFCLFLIVFGTVQLTPDDL